MSALYAVMGWPVAHSRSPAMHNAALRELGLPAVYVPWAVPPARLAAAVEAAGALGCGGFNVTLPHKAAVMPLLAHVEPHALAIGAVNTVVRDAEHWIGTNTDALGLARSLDEAGVVMRGAEIVVLGSGGAARAAVVGLAAAGAARITVCARRVDHAQRLATELSAVCAPAELGAADLGDGLRELLPRAALLIQATSATLGPEAARFAAALDLQHMRPGSAVCDLVYKPRETAVLLAAARAGLRCVDGLGMLLHQGALAFERWTGKPAPIAVMRRALS